MMEPPSMYKVVLAHAALFAANTILGIGSVVSKIGLAGTNPVVFGLLRELLAAPLLFVMSCYMEQSSAERKDCSIAKRFTALDVRQFVLAAGLLFGTNFFYIVGVKVLGATAAAIWQSSLPIFTMTIAVMVGYERLTVLKSFGVLLAFSGCAFVSLAGGSGADGSAQADGYIGNLIFLVQVVACAGFFVAEKPLLRRWSPLSTLAFAYALASSFMLIAAIAINSTPQLLQALCPDCEGDGWAVPHDAVLAIAYWVLLCSVLSYFLLTWGNLYVDATIVGVYFTAQPVGSLLASMIVIAITPPPHYGLEGPGIQDLGALAIFAGVGVLVFDGRQAAAQVAVRAEGGDSSQLLQEQPSRHVHH